MALEMAQIEARAKPQVKAHFHPAPLLAAIQSVVMPDGADRQAVKTFPRTGMGD
jgi:hypothetical protein